MTLAQVQELEDLSKLQKTTQPLPVDIARPAAVIFFLRNLHDKFFFDSKESISCTEFLLT